MNLLKKESHIINNYSNINIKNYLKLLGLILLFNIVYATISATLSYYYNIALPYTNNDITNTKYKLIIRIAKLLIYIPIIETVMFTLWLSPTRRNLIISSFVWLFAFAKFMFFTTIDNNLLFSIELLIYIGIFAGILISRYKKDIFIRYFKYLLAFTTISFGLIHLGNLDNLSLINPIIWPLVVLPQLFLGLILSYTRLKYGFRFALILFANVNFFYVILLLIAFLTH